MPNKELITLTLTRPDRFLCFWCNVLCCDFALSFLAALGPFSILFLLSISDVNRTLFMTTALLNSWRQYAERLSLRPEPEQCQGSLISYLLFENEKKLKSLIEVK